MFVGMSEHEAAQDKKEIDSQITARTCFAHPFLHNAQ